MPSLISTGRRSFGLRRRVRFEQGLAALLVLAHQFGQVVRDGHVQSVDGTAAEVGARVGQLLEFEHRVQAEEVAIDFRIGQIVARDVRQGGQAGVDVVVLRVFDDVVRHLLSVAEEGLVVVVGGQVAVDHFGVISHTDLTEQSEVFIYLSVYTLK